MGGCVEVATQLRHARRYLVGTEEQRVGAQAFGHGYIGRLHPLGVRLLTPVEERGLAAHQARHRVIHHSLILQERVAHYVVALLQPPLVARGKIVLPRRQRPHHAVGGDRP